MRYNLILVVVSSVLVISPILVISSSLDNLVENFSHERLRRHVEIVESNPRQKRQKESDHGVSKTDVNVAEKKTVGTGNRPGDGRQPSSSTLMPVGQDSGAHCLVRCLRPMINNAPQDAGNETLICPKYDPKRMEELCDSYLQAKHCLDECPESPLKNLSMSGFKPLQFMCVERNDDFKKYMPCLTSVCEEVQKQCEPTCGSLDESVRRLARIQQQVRGPGSRSRGADLDVPEIIQTVSDNCELVGCVGNCSKEPMTRKCGAAAYDLQRDTIWTMLSSMAQAMSSVGLNSVWPPQCEHLISSDKERHENEEETEKNRGPNATDRFKDKSNNATSSQNNDVHKADASASEPSTQGPGSSGAASRGGASALVFLFSLLLLNSFRPI